MRAVRGPVVALVVSSVRIVAGPPAQDHSEPYPAADVAAGAPLYAALCANCHGPAGAGVGSIDLRRGPSARASTDAALSAIITNGIPGAGMPGVRLEPNELRALVAFIRLGLGANANTPPIALGDAARGRALFEDQGKCLSCHRVNGKGQYSAPDLTEIGSARTPLALQRSLLDPTGSMLPINRPVRAVTRDGTVITGRRLNEDSYTVQLMSDRGRLVSLVKADLREWTVRTISTMPSYKETLTPEALADIVAYLVSLKASQP